MSAAGSTPGKTLVGLFSSSSSSSSSSSKVVDADASEGEWYNRVEPQTTNDQLAARLVELEEQNALLTSENEVLGQSVKLYQSLLEDASAAPVPVDNIPHRTGHHGGASKFKKGQRRRHKEKAAKVLSAAKTSISVENVTAGMSEDALMVGALNHLVALVKRLALSKAQREAVARQRREQLDAQVRNATPGFNTLDHLLPSDDDLNGAGQERGEALEDSLRHVFVDSVHLLSELIIDPGAMLGREVAEHYCSKSDSTRPSSPEQRRDKEVGAGAEAASPGRSTPSTPVRGDASSPGTSPRKEGWLARPAETKFEQRGSTVRHPITWLLDQFPVLPRGEGAQYDCKDWLPLHWAVISDANELIDVETLLEHYGAPLYYDLQVPPLALAVAKAVPNIDICTTLISYFNAVAAEEAAKKSFATQGGGDAPSPVAEATPVDIVSVAGEVDGVYPFMLAVAYNHGVELLQILREICPKAAFEPDARGWRAIHYAALKGTPTVVSYLLEELPKSAHATTREGCYALHYAARNHLEAEGEGDSLRMLTEILHRNTSAISAADDNGALPLHLAAREGTLEGVRFLCQTYGKAVQVADNEGMQPMHYASSRSEAIAHKTDVVEYILRHSEAD